MGTKAFMAKMAFGTTTLAVQLALFGVIYRYAARSDSSDKVNFVTMFGFALCRALACIPQEFSSDTWLQLGVYFGESALAFGAAACAVEYAWDRGWCRPLWYLDPYGYEESFDGRGGFPPRGGDFYGRVRPTNLNAYGPGPRERELYGPPRDRDFYGPRRR